MDARDELSALLDKVDALRAAPVPNPRRDHLAATRDALEVRVGTGTALWRGLVILLSAAACVVPMAFWYWSEKHYDERYVLMSIYRLEGIAREQAKVAEGKEAALERKIITQSIDQMSKAIDRIEGVMRRP